MATGQGKCATSSHPIQGPTRHAHVVPHAHAHQGAQDYRGALGSAHLKNRAANMKPREKRTWYEAAVKYTTVALHRMGGLHPPTDGASIKLASRNEHRT